MTMQDQYPSLVYRKITEEDAVAFAKKILKEDGNEHKYVFTGKAMLRKEHGAIWWEIDVIYVPDWIPDTVTVWELTNGQTFFEY